MNVRFLYKKLKWQTFYYSVWYIRNWQSNFPVSYIRRSESFVHLHYTGFDFRSAIYHTDTVIHLREVSTTSKVILSSSVAWCQPLTGRRHFQLPPPAREWHTLLRCLDKDIMITFLFTYSVCIHLRKAILHWFLSILKQQS